MGEGAEEGVCIRREVDTGSGRFEIQDRADEGRVLVGKTIMFLTSPC